MTDVRKPRVYSYLRFSTPEQALGDSTRRQIEAASRWADARGLVLDEQLRDEGISGFRGANLRAERGLGSFIRAVESGDVPTGSTLVVESLDRMSRDKVLVANQMLTDLLLRGIRIVTLVDDREFTKDSVDRNPFDLMMTLMVFMRSNEESETKSHRLRASWTAKRQKAVKDKTPMTATCPAWLRKGAQGYELIPDRAAILGRIFAETLSGAGQHAIAERLTVEGLPTWKGGKVWHRTYIKKLLENPAVIGKGELHVTERLPGGGTRRTLAETIEGYYPAAIDAETWERVQTLIATRSAPRGKHAGRATRHLLAGLARCPICSGAMTRINKGVGNGRTFLVCAQAKAKGRCFYKQVRVDEIDAAIFAHHTRLLSRSSTDEAEERIAALAAGQEVAIETIQEEMETLRQHRRARTFTSAMARREEALYADLDAAESALTGYRKQLEVMSSQIAEGRMWRLVDVLEAGPSADLSAANLALREAFSGVVVDYDEGLLTFHWRHGGESQIIYDASKVFSVEPDGDEIEPT